MFLTLIYRIAMLFLSKQYFTKVVSPLALVSPPKECTMLIRRVGLVWPPICVAWSFVRVLWGKGFISVLFSSLGWSKMFRCFQ